MRRRRADDPLPGGEVGAGIGPGKPGQRAVHEPRVRFRHLGGAQPEPSHHSGAEPLDQDVGPLNQRTRYAEVTRRLQVERDVALAPLERGVRRMVPPRTSGRVDPDHIGAVVAEDHRHERGREALAEVDDADASECAGHAARPYGLINVS